MPVSVMRMTGVGSLSAPAHPTAAEIDEAEAVCAELVRARPLRRNGASEQPPENGPAQQRMVAIRLAMRRGKYVCDRVRSGPRLTLLRTNYISALGTPTISAMDGSSSAPEPRQVSAMSCRFAGPTSGTVARAYSSLDSPCNRLALVCRLRNIVTDVLQEPLKMM